MHLRRPVSWLEIGALGLPLLSIGPASVLPAKIVKTPLRIIVKAIARSTGIGEENTPRPPEREKCELHAHHEVFSPTIALRAAFGPSTVWNCCEPPFLRRAGKRSGWNRSSG